MKKDELPLHMQIHLVSIQLKGIGSNLKSTDISRSKIFSELGDAFYILGLTIKKISTEIIELNVKLETQLDN